MLELKDISVNYSYKKVLTKISVCFEKGKIYSLLGENGAGKTTLARVICGDILQTSGELFLNNKKLLIHKPKDAIKNGIVCVHQRPLLAPSLSIKDNLRIGISREMAKNIPEIVKKWLPNRKITDSVNQLSESEVFFTAFAGALLKKPLILILDEPPFIEKSVLKDLCKNGLTIIMITHNLEEALEKSDEVILLKDGEILEKTETSKITTADISKKLFGLTKIVKLPKELQIKKISEDEVLEKRKNNFTGYIPSDRTFRASNPALTIFQLLTAYKTEKKQSELEEYAKQLLQKADVNIKLNEKAVCLSGGMLQRLILERELAENPKELYLFNPTHGLDVEATEKLYSRLVTLAKNGTKVIIGN